MGPLARVLTIEAWEKPLGGGKEEESQGGACARKKKKRGEEKERREGKGEKKKKWPGRQGKLDFKRPSDAPEGGKGNPSECKIPAITKYPGQGKNGLRTKENCKIHREIGCFFVFT